MKPKEALPRRYDAEMVEALNHGPVMRIFTGGNAAVWPERFRKVGYYYEMKKEVFKLTGVRVAVLGGANDVFGR